MISYPSLRVFEKQSPRQQEIALPAARNDEPENYETYPQLANRFRIEYKA